MLQLRENNQLLNDRLRKITLMTKEVNTENHELKSMLNKFEENHVKT